MRGAICSSHGRVDHHSCQIVRSDHPAGKQHPKYGIDRAGNANTDRRREELKEMLSSAFAGRGDCSRNHDLSAGDDLASRVFATTTSSTTYLEYIADFRRK
jgi:hypothetical protein